MAYTWLSKERRAMQATALVLAVMMSVLYGHAVAQSFPSRSVTIIVPFSPGGSADTQARLIAKGLAEKLGKPVVVENRPGAGGRIGADIAARAKADGHTLLLGQLSTLVIEPVLRTNVGYDPKRDFAPVILIAEAPLVLIVASSLPVANLNDLLTYARKPGTKLTYASSGPGTAAHLLGETLRATEKLDVVHVPYKGGAPALTDLIGGQVSMMFATSVMAGPQIRSGKIRALGVTGSERLEMLPQVPTFAEMGYKRLDLQAWYALLAPAKTPAPVVMRLNKEGTAVVKSAEFVRAATDDGAVVVAGSPEQLAKRIESDTEAIHRLVKEAKFKLEE
jgi:tripartite-type tricarboxylate transporter receptor subunit TctC